MSHRQAILLILLATSSSACAEQTEDDYRTQYRSMILSSCENKTPVEGPLTAELRDVYCTCSADTIVSSHTVAELKALYTFPADPTLEKGVQDIMLNCARQVAEGAR